MKKISNTQKYAILWLHSQKMSTQDIAKELKIDQENISQIVSGVQQPQKEAVNSTMKNLMITESSAQKHKVAVMTKAASEISDSDRTKMQINNTNKNFIYKPGSKT